MTIEQMDVTVFSQSFGNIMTQLEECTFYTEEMKNILQNLAPFLISTKLSKLTLQGSFNGDFDMTRESTHIRWNLPCVTDLHVDYLPLLDSCPALTKVSCCWLTPGQLYCILKNAPRILSIIVDQPCYSGDALVNDVPLILEDSNKFAGSRSLKSFKSVNTVLFPLVIPLISSCFQLTYLNMELIFPSW